LKLREELFARLDVEASVRNALELLKDQGLKGVLLEDEAGKPAAVVMTVDALIGLMYEDLMNTDGTFFTSRAGPHQPLKLFMPDTLVEQVDPTGNWLPDFPPVGPPPDKPLSD
jgi:hypothetical protein